VLSEPRPNPTSSPTALLIVDAQVGVMTTVWAASRVIANLTTLVQGARAVGVPIIWVQHSDPDALPYGSATWQLLPDLPPTATETVIHKRYNSSFADTDLEPRLQALGIHHIVLAGGLTNWCIRSTAYAASNAVTT
jgi:nicotinamidase-related amidase